MHAALLLLSALPSALALHSYSVPMNLRVAEADNDDPCVLPDDYHIVGYSSEAKSDGQTLSAFNFTFKDDTTNITTPCEFNSSSVSVPGNGTPRYLCDNNDIEFLWQDEERRLTMIQKVCPDTNGASAYEVAGGVRLWIKCPESGGACATNTTDYRALFVSLNPVMNPSRV
ncbi:hypothetical protein AK830_g9455 [Neonectria ditissima]|uniref:AA1-like domain-containing protein n=1 Tax=Neonectria ditissima TaxID=78410 RepID=A0A0P7AUQ4_9HYPO|nr:hypothetical protein AK830_g9455 [Neonectria ditissima]